VNDQIGKLLQSAGRGDLPFVRDFIEQGGSPNICNHLGYTPLMSACASYRVEVVSFLLQAGADVNQLANDKESALHAAVRSSPSLPEQQRECVRLLLEHGAEVDPASATGGTPLMSAAWFGCLLAVEELLGAGASLKLKDSQGSTAKDLAESGYALDSPYPNR
jgi:ankyrin repeat protein